MVGQVLDELEGARGLQGPARRLAVVRIASLLDEQGRKDLARASADPDNDDLVIDVLREQTRGAAAADGRWAVPFIRWVADSPISESRALRVLSDVAWSRRQSGQSVLGSLTFVDLLAEPAGSDRSLCAFVAFLQSARYDFNFDVINRGLSVLPDATRRRMPDYFAALALFAAYGTGQHSRSEEVLEIAGRAMDPKVLHVLAHALWFSSREDDSTALVHVAERILGMNEVDLIASYRLGAGLRRLGRFDEALAAVNRAIADCPALDLENNNMLIEEQQRIVLQADLITRTQRSTAAAVAGFEATIRETEDRIRGELRAELEQASTATSDAQFKVVEILGLFTAIIAVVATGFVGGMSGDLSWWQRLVVVLGGAVASLGFFVMLRFVVRPTRLAG